MAGRQRRDGGPVEAALFISETASDLAGLANHHHLDVLRLLLDMAKLEAEEQAKVRADDNSPHA